MDSSYLAFMEFFIVIAAVVGWGVIELVALRQDKRRREEHERDRAAAAAKEPNNT